MAEIIRTILVMSVSGSIIALLLFALKPLIKNRLPKSTQYYLWLIVIAALLVPVSKIVSIPQYAEHIPSVPIYSIVESNVISTPELNEQFIQIQQENPNIIGYSVQENPVSIVVDIVSYVYPLGIGIVLIYQLIAYALFLRKIRHNIKPADVTCKIPVYFNTKATTPMLVGLFRPKIILPEREYSDEQLQAVLLHELTHLRRKDILIKWLSCFACAVHWFNPIVWLICREIDRACELSCDEAVIAKLDTSGRQTYGDTLIYVAADHKPSTALAMSESGRNLKERLGAIMKNKKRTRIAIIVSIMLIAIITVAAIVLGGGKGKSDKGYEFYPHIDPVSIQHISYSPAADSVSVTVDFVSSKGPSELILTLANSEGQSDKQPIRVGESVTLTLSAHLDSELTATAVGNGRGKAYLDVSVRYTTDEAKVVTQILDYYLKGDMPWDESYEFTIPEYPGTKFEWTSEKITAIENGEETELFTGMPIWSVFLCDLTGDGLPEICSTVAIGSGIIDNRIIVYDYKNRMMYELSDRFNYDYSLSLYNQKLVAIQKAFDLNNEGSATYGSLSIIDGKLILTEIVYGIEDEYATTYTNSEYGFSIAFPDSWVDKASVVYTSDEFGERFEIYSPITNVGPAAYIDVHDKSTLRMSGAKEADKLYKDIGENSAYEFVLIVKTGLPFDPNDEDASELFLLIQEDLAEGNFTFTVFEPSGGATISDRPSIVELTVTREGVEEKLPAKLAESSRFGYEIYLLSDFELIESGEKDLIRPKADSDISQEIYVLVYKAEAADAIYESRGDELVIQYRSIPLLDGSNQSFYLEYNFPPEDEEGDALLLKAMAQTIVKTNSD